MELEDKTEDHDSPMDCSGGDKICLTQIHKSMEEFLHMVFTSVSDTDLRKLWHLIVVGTPFTAIPWLDEVMAAKCLY